MDKMNFLGYIIITIAALYLIVIGLGLWILAEFFKRDAEVDLLEMRIQLLEERINNLDPFSTQEYSEPIHSVGGQQNASRVRQMQESRRTDSNDHGATQEPGS